MGRQTRTVNSSSSKGGVGAQPGGVMPNSESINTVRAPNDHLETGPEIPPLPTTNLASSEASPPMPAGSNDGGTSVAEEQDYDMCTDYMNTQDDDYGFVLVAPEPNPMPQQAVSKRLDKGQDISEK